MAIPREAIARKLPRVTDGKFSESLSGFVSRTCQSDLILSKPQTSESPEMIHDRRVRRTAETLRELGIVFRQNPLLFGGGGSKHFPVHFDDDPDGWSFQVHTTLAVGGKLYAARQNTEHPLRGDAISEANQRVQDVGWPTYVDSDIVADGVVWHGDLSPGDTVLLHVGNIRRPDLPAGSWHEFTVSNSSRRIAVAHFVIDPPIIRW